MLGNLYENCDKYKMKMSCVLIACWFILFLFFYTSTSAALLCETQRRSCVCACDICSQLMAHTYCAEMLMIYRSALWNKPLKVVEGGVVGESHWHWRLQSHHWGGLPSEWVEESEQHRCERETAVEESSSAVTVTLRVGANNLAPHHWPHSWFLVEVKERDSRGLHLFLWLRK